VADVTVPPDLWDVKVVPEGVVSNWFYRDGARVAAGVKIAEVMAEKSAYDIAAPVGGELRILIPKDAVITPGTVIGRIDEG